MNCAELQQLRVYVRTDGPWGDFFEDGYFIFHETKACLFGECIIVRWRLYLPARHISGGRYNDKFECIIRAAVRGPEYMQCSQDGGQLNGLQ